MITLQSIFNKAWNHFILMDNPPATQFNRQEMRFDCCYETKDGRRCAIGLSLPSGKCQGIEGVPFGTVVKEGAVPDEVDPDMHKWNQGELDWFQMDLHDSLLEIHTGRWGGGKRWRMNSYRDVASKHKLILPMDHTKATRYTKERAEEIVAQLSFGELDGWTYTTHHSEDAPVGYVVHVYDENGEFVSYWNE